MDLDFYEYVRAPQRRSRHVLFEVEHTVVNLDGVAVTEPMKKVHSNRFGNEDVTETDNTETELTEKEFTEIGMVITINGEGQITFDPKKLIKMAEILANIPGGSLENQSYKQMVKIAYALVPFFV